MGNDITDYDVVCDFGVLGGLVLVNVKTCFSAIDVDNVWEE